MRSLVVKKLLTMGLAGAALAATLTFVGAGSRAVESEPVAAVPGSTILASIRDMGLDPIGEPVRRGRYYVLQAYDSRGIEMRVVADAELGDILSVFPARAVNATLAPRYERGPRIIHVPPRDERGDDATSDTREAPAAGNDDGQATPAQPQATPKAKPRKRAEAPAAPRRTVLSAPPPPADMSLTPIHPTPRFDAPAESDEKFAPPKNTP